MIFRDGKGANFQLLEMSRPSTSTSSSQTGVGLVGLGGLGWVGLGGGEKLLESAAGVALSSGLIQVSVRAMSFSLE